MNEAQKPWDAEGYGDVAAVRSLAGVIDVTFANGDVVEVPATDLGFDLLTKFKFDAEARAVVAETGEGVREIDWMAIRAADDPAFAAEVRQRDAEEAVRVGRRLRALRERSGLSRTELAGRLGTSRQAIEATETGAQGVDLGKIEPILAALDAEFADLADPGASEISFEELEESVGAPADVVRKIATAVAAPDAASLIARAFKWDLEGVLRGSPSGPPLTAPVRFKTRQQGPVSRSAIERLARTLSELTAEATAAPSPSLPESAAEIRAEVLGREGTQVSMETLLDWAWGHGVAVVPMSGPGFQAAAWYVGERPVVVLKLSHPYRSYWLFALAHELGHLVLGHVDRDEGLVDLEDPGSLRDDAQEQEADHFARDLLVPGSEALFAEIRRRSGDTPDEQRRRFKFKMIEVAKQAGLEPDQLGFLAAFAMTDVARQRDRWGSATKIAKTLPDGAPIARGWYRRHVEIGRLKEMDAALVEAVVLE